MSAAPPRLLLLLPTTTYRAAAFVGAAEALGLRLVVASETDSAFSATAPDRLLTLDFADPGACVPRVRAFHQTHPLQAVFGVDDQTALMAAHLAYALDLEGNSVAAARAAAVKSEQRRLMADAGVPVPHFQHFVSTEDARQTTIPFPAVVKPVSLSASRGVMRVDDRPGLERALVRLGAILEEAASPERRSCLVEEFVPGPEFALEGLLVDGRLHTLALFDKPDPLDGPTFEETLYVTPSRAEHKVQEALIATTQAATRALGLTTGPVHAELRHNQRGPWMVELAARPIGGRCGEVLRFGADGEQSLETVLLGHALDTNRPIPPRERAASGVMMIPVPRPGTFEEFRGIEQAGAVPGIVDVAITIHRGAGVRPLPEEARYLGFVFARAETAAQVETSLRRARELLEIVIR